MEGVVDVGVVGVGAVAGLELVDVAAGSVEATVARSESDGAVNHPTMAPSSAAAAINASEIGHISLPLMDAPHVVASIPVGCVVAIAT